jgi:hypothetical protein
MRKIEFKAKETIEPDWVFGNYMRSDWFEDNIQGKDLEPKHIDPATLCQLITEINGVKIFEYDCYYANSSIIFFNYDINGQLNYNHYFFSENTLNKYNAGVADVNWYIQYLHKYSNGLIGNWHDGEQFLLDKIKGI